MLSLGGIFVLLATGQIGTAAGADARRMEIASAWAPTIFHDEAREFTQMETGFNPVDTPVGFFFDGNKDVRDNGSSIFRLTTEQEEKAIEDLPIYFSLVETRTHYYLNYVVYHAIDTNRVGHVHDTENIFLILQKEENGPGKLVAAITNAHGFPMIYSEDPSLSKAWLARTHLSAEKDFLPLIDRFSKNHHEMGEPEWISRGDSQSLKVFVSSQSHAIYKFNTDAWLQQEMGGVAYYPKSCGDCEARLVLQPLKGVREIRSYALVDLDQMLEKAFSARDEVQEVFLAKTKRAKLKNDIYRERLVPGYLAAGFEETEAKANLFFRTSLKTDYPLSDPISFHRFLAGDDGKNISTIYFYNPYLEAKPIRGSLLASAPSTPRPPLQTSISKASFLGIAERIINRLSP